MSRSPMTHAIRGNTECLWMCSEIRIMIYNNGIRHCRQPVKKDISRSNQDKIQNFRCVQNNDDELRRYHRMFVGICNTSSYPHQYEVLLN